MTPPKFTNGIAIHQLNKAFGAHQIFTDYSENIPKSTVTALLGPSGCGKTTLLRILSGLEHADSGHFELPQHGNASWIFQESRLIPWLTAGENIQYIMNGSHFGSRESKTNAESLLNLLGLAGKADLLPKALSGGMARRVALARSLAQPASILFMDEPFTGLDTELRLQIAENVFELCRKRETTVLWATHDSFLANRFSSGVLMFSHISNNPQYFSRNGESHEPL